MLQLRPREAKQNKTKQNKKNQNKQTKTVAEQFYLLTPVLALAHCLVAFVAHSLQAAILKL